MASWDINSRCYTVGLHLQRGRKWKKSPEGLTSLRSERKLWFSVWTCCSQTHKNTNFSDQTYNLTHQRVSSTAVTEPRIQEETFTEETNSGSSLIKHRLIWTKSQTFHFRLELRRIKWLLLHKRNKEENTLGSSNSWGHIRNLSNTSKWNTERKQQ